MRRTLLVLLGLVAVPACLELGGVDEVSNETGGSGGIHADSSFPDSSGGGSGGSGGSAGLAGSAGAASGGSAGAVSSWKLHTFDAPSNKWSTIALSSVWAGQNAPPSYGILAVTQLEHFDRLLVFTDDGKFHLRADGVWQPPLSTNDTFPALAPLQMRSVYHVPSPPGTVPLDETITFIANPIAVSYEYHANDAIVFLEQTTMSDDPPPAPPLNSGSCVFDFEVRDPTKYLQSADYYLLYAYFTDGNLYRFDAAFDWAKWPANSAPYLSEPNAPDPATISAAWYEEELDRVQLVGP